VKSNSYMYKSEIDDDKEIYIMLGIFACGACWPSYRRYHTSLPTCEYIRISRGFRTNSSDLMIRCCCRAFHQRRQIILSTPRSFRPITRITLSPTLCSRPTSSYTTLSKPAAMYPPIKPYESGFFQGANSEKHQL
jgi:hypothetical protein